MRVIKRVASRVLRDGAAALTQAAFAQFRGRKIEMVRGDASHPHQGALSNEV